MRHTNNIWHGRGRLTSDPKIYETKDGPSKAIFTIAINNRRKTKENTYVDDADFINCEVWDSAAKSIAKYGKGYELELVGTMKSYTRKMVLQSGEEKTVSSIYCRVTSFTPLRPSKASLEKVEQHG
jgi:single-stranded DNA-binding protein